MHDSLYLSRAWSNSLSGCGTFKDQTWVDGGACREIHTDGPDGAMAGWPAPHLKIQSTMPGDGSFGVSGGINQGVQPELIESAVGIKRGVTAGCLSVCGGTMPVPA